MLRKSLLAFAAALTLAGLLLLAHGIAGPGAYALGTGGLILLGTAFERWRYHPQQARPDATWQATGERFEDPESGRTLRVLYDARSGERRYIADSEEPSAGEVQSKP